MHSGGRGQQPVDGRQPPLCIQAPPLVRHSVIDRKHSAGMFVFEPCGPTVE